MLIPVLKVPFPSWSGTLVSIMQDSAQKHFQGSNMGFMSPTEVTILVHLAFPVPQPTARLHIPLLCTQPSDC